MREISASELTLGYIGNRVVVIDNTGNAYTGVLTDMGATDWKYGKRPEDQVRIRIAVSSEERSKLELSALPLDFRLQIESAECDGSGTCSAPIHVHGCYTPHRSDQCDSPDEYGHTDRTNRSEETD